MKFSKEIIFRKSKKSKEKMKLFLKNPKKKAENFLYFCGSLLSK